MKGTNEGWNKDAKKHEESANPGIYTTERGAERAIW